MKFFVVIFSDVIVQQLCTVEEDLYLPVTYFKTLAGGSLADVVDGRADLRR